MKRWTWQRVTSILCAVCAIIGAPHFAGAKAARPILMTVYQQAGWGDAVQIGYVDEAGGLWLITGQDRELSWPDDLDQQLAWLAAYGSPVATGTLSHDELFELNSLVACVTASAEQPSPAANDAGTECSYAIRYAQDEAEAVLLGVSGDSRFENEDSTAQALYLFLRNAFTDVTSYYGHPHMGPVGFQPVSLLRFCGYEGIDLSRADMLRGENDCEAFTPSVPLGEAEADELKAWLRQVRVTGKRSCVVTTGGSVSYTLIDPDGTQLASLEFYHGLLVRDDGMYTVAE